MVTKKLNSLPLFSVVHLGHRAKAEAKLEEMLKEGAGLQALSPEGRGGGTEEGCMLRISRVSSPFGSTFLSVLCWWRLC